MTEPLKKQPVSDIPERRTPHRTPEKSIAASSRRGTWARLDPLLRLLILTQLAFNVGFYAVLPFLAGHLGTAIGMAGWMVGFVLGLRTFSQQGLFVVGGALADRYGVRPWSWPDAYCGSPGSSGSGTPTPTGP